MKKQLLIAALAVCASGQVMAADDLFGSSSEGDGGTIYGGVSLGKTQAECAGSAECDSSNWKLYGGYEITSDIAVEGAYHSIASSGSNKVTGISAAGLYSMPVADNLEAFGKAGMIAWDSDGTDNGTDFLLGAGATYKMDENWGVRGEYERIGGDIKANMYSVGAVFSTL